jgi:hypothetical protein
MGIKRSKSNLHVQLPQVLLSRPLTLPMSKVEYELKGHWRGCFQAMPRWNRWRLLALCAPDTG